MIGILLALTLTFARPTPIELTYDEAQLIMRVAQAESGNQGEHGMWLTMSVIINRVEKSDFPDTVDEVIYQKGQFSTVSNGAINKVELSPECHMALAQIESGYVAPEIVAFETTSSNELEKWFTSAFEYRDHRFYTQKIN